MKDATRDNILYITIALVIVAALGLVAWYQDAHGQRIHMPIAEKPFLVLFSTAGVFGYAVKYRRKSLDSTRFWMVLSVAFVLFIPLQWRILSRTFGVASFGALSVLELFLLLAILDKLVPREGIGSGSSAERR